VLEPGGFSVITVSGDLREDGSVELAGDELVGDFTGSVRGNASARIDAGVVRITGTLDRTRAFGTDVRFTMERPVGATLTKFSAPYRFEFPESPGGCGCRSSATIAATFGADGIGQF
jgi:hypothetical protein